MQTLQSSVEQSSIADATNEIRQQAAAEVLAVRETKAREIEQLKASALTDRDAAVREAVDQHTARHEAARTVRGTHACAYACVVVRVTRAARRPLQRRLGPAATLTASPPTTRDLPGK